MPASVVDYLEELPEPRRAVVAAVREVVNRHLPVGYEEGIQYGMIAWFVPRSRYPAGYHANPKLPLPFVNLAATKSHYALYLMPVYEDTELSAWFRSEFEKTGKKLDMGKSCVRFKRLEDLPLELIGRTVAQVPVASWIASYEAARHGVKKAALAPSESAVRKQPVSKKSATKKAR